MIKNEDSKEVKGTCFLSPEKEREAEKPVTLNSGEKKEITPNIKPRH